MNLSPSVAMCTLLLLASACSFGSAPSEGASLQQRVKEHAAVGKEAAEEETDAEGAAEDEEEAVGPSGTCQPARTACESTCVDLQAHSKHCGACGNACSVPANGVAKCTDAVCGVACSPGYVACQAGCCAAAGVVDTSKASETLATGSGFSCMIVAGAVKCWGSNYYGMLGNGGTTGSGKRSLKPVSVSTVSGATSIAAGDAHACVVVSGGAVSCWGKNWDGQLGNGATDSDSNVPVAVSGVSGAVSLALAENHSCALITDGTVTCWGKGQTKQVSAATIAGVTGATAIAAGGDATCAITAGGAVSCWHTGWSGGIGGRVPTVVAGVSPATSIAVGETHACAVVGGTVRCWGSNVYGQLGNGTTTTSTTPVSTMSISGAMAVAAGPVSTCALLSGGAASCWGFGLSNQPTQSSAPIGVPALSGASVLKVGRKHACVVAAGGAVLCWGANDGGQLGNGQTTDSAAPVAVVGL